MLRKILHHIPFLIKDQITFSRARRNILQFWEHKTLNDKRKYNSTASLKCTFYEEHTFIVNHKSIRVLYQDFYFKICWIKVIILMSRHCMYLCSSPNHTYNHINVIFDFVPSLSFVFHLKTRAIKLAENFISIHLFSNICSIYFCTIAWNWRLWINKNVNYYI